MPKPIAKVSDWYRITNAADDEARVDIYDFIGEGWDGRGVSARQFVKDLRNVKAKTIHVHVNSDGGMITDATAIHTALRKHKAEIVVHIDGIAASAASFIAMAGDRILMAEPAFLMVHNPMGGAWGYSDDLMAVAEVLDKMRDQIAKLYADRSGQTLEKCKELMNAETWMTSDEALELGFIDAIDKEASSVKAAASTLLLKYRNAPEVLKKLVNAAASAAAPVAPVKAATHTGNTVPKNEETAAEQTAVTEGNTDAEDVRTAGEDEGAEQTAEATASAAPTAKVATVAELKAAIPTCTADFRETCIENKLTLDQAKAMHAMVGTAANNKRAGGPGLKTNPASTGVNAGGDFMSAVAAYRDENKCDYRTAASAVARANPQLHEAYVLAQKPQRSRPVENGAAD